MSEDTEHWLLVLIVNSTPELSPVLWSRLQREPCAKSETQQTCSKFIVPVYTSSFHSWGRLFEITEPLNIILTSSPSFYCLGYLRCTRTSKEDRLSSDRQVGLRISFQCMGYSLVMTTLCHRKNTFLNHISLNRWEFSIRKKCRVCVTCCFLVVIIGCLADLPFWHPYIRVPIQVKLCLRGKKGGPILTSLTTFKCIPLCPPQQSPQP